MFGDHRFLIGVADQHAHGIPPAANFRAVGAIGLRVQIDAKKAKPRADARTQGIPIIMLTAKGDEVDRIVGLEIGADDYLPKPFDAVLLKARIGAALEKKRLRDQEIRQNLSLRAIRRTR